MRPTTPLSAPRNKIDSMPLSSHPQGRRDQPTSRRSRRRRGPTGSPSWPQRPPRPCGRPKDSPSGVHPPTSLISQAPQRRPSSTKHSWIISFLAIQLGSPIPSCSRSGNASRWHGTRLAGPLPAPPRHRPQGPTQSLTRFGKGCTAWPLTSSTTFWPSW